MADDPISLEEATEKRADEDDTDPGPEDEYNPNIKFKTAEELFGDADTITEVVPDFLRPESDSVEQPDLGGRRGGFGIDVDIGDLSDLSSPGLLEVIARVNIAQLATMFDIADAVEPFQSITVSGVNATDDADAAEPVVPESDNEAIPTRTLLVRASQDNTSKIYFGDDRVSPESGFVLQRGEMIALDVDLRAEEMYMASKEEGQTVELLGFV